MNPETPPSPREELEIRLTAMLMGELSPEETAALQTQMAADPELAALHARLGQAMELLREASALPEHPTPPEPVQLSAKKREHLLAHFKAPSPSTVIVKPRRHWKPYVPLGLAASLIALLGGSVFLNGFVLRKASRPAGAMRMLEDRRSVDFAVDQYAVESKSFRGVTAPDPAEARWESQPGSVRILNRSDVAGGSGGADANGTRLGFQQPPSANAPTSGRTTFGREDESAKLSVYTASEGKLWDAPAPEGLRRSVRFAEPSSAPVSASAGSAQPLTPLAAESAPLPATDDAVANSLFAQVPDGGVISPDGKIDRLGRAGGRSDVAADVPIQLPTGVAGVAPAHAGPGDFARGLSKHMDGAFGDKADVASVTGAISMRDAPITPLFAGGAVKLPALTSAKSALTPDGAKKAYFFDREADGFADLKEPKLAPASGPAPASPPFPEMLSKSDFITAAPDDADANRITLGEREKMRKSAESEGREMKKRGEDFGAISGTSGGIAAAQNPDANPLAWFGDAQSSGAKVPAPAKKVPYFLGRAVEENVELALAEKPAAPTDKSGVEAPVPRSLAVAPAQAQKTLEDREGLIAGKEVRAKNKIVPPAKPAAVAKKGAKPEAKAERLYESVDELAQDITPDAPKIRELSTEASAGLLEATAKQAQARNASETAETTKLAKLEMLKQQVALKDFDDKPAAPKPAEPAPEPQAEIATSANAFSTFSLNVSDVAFKLAGASLEKGQMPELATVRSEEFINAFDYHDPEPAGGAPLAFASERARYPFAQNRDLLRLSVKTAAAGRQPARALNLVLLLDNSGSMERADRVRILHESLRVLAAQLQPQDKLSVVTFARTPRLWADGVAGDKAGEVTARVGEITPQGGTNLDAALDLGYATARKHFQPGSINRVVLLTDGAANLGDVNPDALKQKVETNRRQGVALDCFGIGWEGYDDTLLEALSRNGDGRYGFINSPEEAATEFAAQLAGALRVAASDVKVQVEFNPRRVTAYRQIGYAKHQLKKEQFRDNTVDAAEIGAAESGNALYAVEVNPRGEGDLATVRVRFKVPGTSDYREHEWTVPFTREAAPLGQASPALRLAGTASAFSEWLVSSQYATEVTPDRLLSLLNGVPATFGADPRPQKLEWMIRQAKSVSGR